MISIPTYSLGNSDASRKVNGPSFIKRDYLGSISTSLEIFDKSFEFIVFYVMFIEFL